MPSRHHHNRLQRPHVSYSQLSQYMRCPLSYYFQRILGLKSPFTPSGLVFGSAVHEALAEYHRGLQRGQVIDVEQVHAEFRAVWHQFEKEKPIQYGRRESKDGLLELGTALLTKYTAEKQPQNIVGVEQQMVVPLWTSRGEVLEKPLVAVVDLLCRQEEGLVITELKTSKRRYGQAEVDTAPQATCYAHAIREKFDEPAALQYVVLVKTKTPQIQTLTTERTVADMGRLGDTVQAVERAIQAQVFYPIENPMNCSGCAYREPCRDWQGHHQADEHDLSVEHPVEIA